MISHTTTNSRLIRVSALLAAVLASGAGYGADSMGKSDYSAAKKQISADYKAEKAACDKFSDNAKDVCVEKAKGKEKVAMAELTYNNETTPKNAMKLAEAKGDAAYAVAKEKCDDRSGNDKDVCVSEAKAAHTKATADAKMHSEVSDAQKSATSDKRDADYKVAAQKCDSLAGDAKSACMTEAKARFGKS